jgi:hypothetical protein
VWSQRSARDGVTAACFVVPLALETEQSPQPHQDHRWCWGLCRGVTLAWGTRSRPFSQGPGVVSSYQKGRNKRRGLEALAAELMAKVTPIHLPLAVEVDTRVPVVPDAASCWE